MDPVELMHNLGLGGCTELVRFDDQVTMARAVGTLMGCHQHHFVVAPDAGMGWAIAVSPRGVRCLTEKLTGGDRLRYNAPEPFGEGTTPPPPPPPEISTLPW